VSSPECQRIGHGGASALAPANTLHSFDAALEVGVDMVEFDVRAWRGELLLAHTIVDARRARKLRLHDALEHLSSTRFLGIELNVDLKHLGCEPALLDALRRWGLLERTLISCQVPAVLDRVRALEPRAHTGISVGGRLARASRRWRDWRSQVLVGLASRRWDALMAQHGLVDASLLEEVLHRRGRLYAWTVNERATIDGLRALGVHGITTADPRLFV
jgi:glycerophosphoryl diester phosphodiesterase